MHWLLPGTKTALDWFLPFQNHTKRKLSLGQVQDRTFRENVPTLPLNFYILAETYLTLLLLYPKNIDSFISIKMQNKYPLSTHYIYN